MSRARARCFEDTALDKQTLISLLLPLTKNLVGGFFMKKNTIEELLKSIDDSLTAILYHLKIKKEGEK